ncbi:MAG: hypothetical protein ABIS50_03040 [Luteolibacter sp.]|uniref:hypothetical protein n=1 Tax=Luteolibacter sp. TaxID=1962973 RepID=UPI00326327F3
MLKIALICLLPLAAFAVEPCRIEIVDKENGWPVPLVELRSVHDTVHVSDNLGLVAIEDPDLLDREVWFTIKGHGYGVSKDGFGFEGVRATLKAGGKFRIEVERRNIAKRLGRLTGAGLFAEGEKLGIPPLLPETGVFGCDSVLTAKFDGKLFYLWGDTIQPGYPLGIYNSTAATVPLEPLKKFEPPLAMPFTHFRDDKGKPRGVAEIPGDGPTWLGGMISFDDNHLGATYSKIKGHLEEYETGLCVWDAASQKFLPEKVLWKKSDGQKPITLQGHPVRWKDPEGKSWLLFGDPFPTARCPDDFESWKNPATWERIPKADNPRTAADNSEVQAHRGSIAWNAFRRRWIAVFTQNFGKPSTFGEIWYAEADSPLGPWVSAVKVLTHDNYTFYNPKIQNDLTPENAPFILFEGTYTAEFADHASPTARYNYNQILYRLDLDDPKLRH